MDGGSRLTLEEITGKVLRIIRAEVSELPIGVFLSVEGDLDEAERALATIPAESKNRREDWGLSPTELASLLEPLQRAVLKAWYAHKTPPGGNLHQLAQMFADLLLRLGGGPRPSWLPPEEGT